MIVYLAEETSIEEICDKPWCLHLERPKWLCWQGSDLILHIVMDSRKCGIQCDDYHNHCYSGILVTTCIFSLCSSDCWIFSTSFFAITQESYKINHVIHWEICVTIKIGNVTVAMTIWSLKVLQLVKQHFYCSLSYASPPIWKLHPYSDIISKLYKLTFLTTCLMVMLQPSRYSIFHGRDTPIQLSLLWQS